MKAELIAHVVKRQEELRKARSLMVEYMKLRMENGDMHGVMDATADIREIDAALAELEPIAVLVSTLEEPAGFPTWPSPLGILDPTKVTAT